MLQPKQAKFAHMCALLILHAEQLGYTVTFGDAYRYHDCPYGAKDSLHKQRLALDLNVFRDGIYLRKGYDDLGEYWESIGGSWGGRFNDDNHFSLEHGGLV